MSRRGGYPVAELVGQGSSGGCLGGPPHLDSAPRAVVVPDPGPSSPGVGLASPRGHRHALVVLVVDVAGGGDLPPLAKDHRWSSHDCSGAFLPGALPGVAVDERSRVSGGLINGIDP